MTTADTVSPSGPERVPTPHPTRDTLAPFRKRAVDVALSLAIGIVAAPLVLLLIALVRLTSRGPAIYSQVRVGHGRRNFQIYKLRTMYHDCERLSGPKWSTDNDPRVTPLGRFLRRTHLDELPQLWNILKGEMSLVGPRPERPEFVSELERALPGYAGRLRVLPGLTGLAQVNLPPDIDYDSVRRKLAFDLYYAAHAGTWLDLKILVGTGLMTLGMPPSALGRLLGLRPGRLASVADEHLDTSTRPSSLPEIVSHPPALAAWHET